MSTDHCVVRWGDAAILMDPEDLETLQSVLAAGWTLEMPRDRRSGTRTPTLVLRGFGIIKLARAIMQATESQYVFQTGPSGPLDCRKAHMRLQDAGRRIGWSSKINGSGPRASPYA